MISTETADRARGPAPTALELLASALAGCRVSITVDARSARVWSDGLVIHISDGSARVHVLAQAALIAAGSLEPDIMAELVGRPRLTVRYLSLEVRRAAPLAASLLPLAGASLLDGLTPPSTSSAAESLAVARRQRRNATPPSWWGRLRPSAILRRQARDTAPADDNGARSQAAEYDRREERRHKNSDTLLLSSFTRLRAAPHSFKRATSWTLTPSSGPPPPSATALTPVRARPRSSRWASPGRSSHTAPPELTHAAAYPEWDEHRERYREDWCHVRQGAAPAGSSRHAQPPEHPRLRRELALLARQRATVRRQAWGDDVDLDAAVEAHVERSAGVPTRALSYLDRLPRRSDLSILVLLDASGSALDVGPDGRTVYDHHHDGADTLVRVAEQVGHRVALHTFRSHGRGAIEILRVKAFGDPYDAEARARLAGTEPDGHTRLGAALRWAASYLESEGSSQRKLVLLLSDGFAYDLDYEGHYAVADARRAINEALGSGVGVLCVSLAVPDPDDDLEQVFGSTTHARADDLAMLAPYIGRFVRSALALAQIRRGLRHRCWSDSGQR